MGILIKNIVKMALNGSVGMQLYKKDDYSKYIPHSAIQLSEENWARLGSNLRNAMNKVGEEYERKV